MAPAIPRWDRRADPKSVGRFVALTPLVCSPQTAVVIVLRASTAFFVRADGLPRSQYAVRRNSFPRTSITVTPQMRESLAEALRDYYWPHEMRGRHCHVEHYTRSGGNEYFFAYLDDWPDSRLVFEDNGTLEAVSQRFAFSVLFVFCPQDGSLELVARGSKAVHYPLQRAFAKSMFGIDVAPVDPLRPVCDLQPLLEPDLTYPTETTDRIALVRLKRIRLAGRLHDAGLKSCDPCSFAEPFYLYRYDNSSYHVSYLDDAGYHSLGDAELNRCQVQVGWLRDYEEVKRGRGSFLCGAGGSGILFGSSSEPLCSLEKQPCPDKSVLMKAVRSTMPSIAEMRGR